MELFLFSFVLIFIAFAGIAIKIWVALPSLNKENKPCGICGKMPEETECKNPVSFNN